MTFRFTMPNLEGNDRTGGPVHERQHGSLDALKGGSIKTEHSEFLYYTQHSFEMLFKLAYKGHQKDKKEIILFLSSL